MRIKTFITLMCGTVILLTVLCGRNPGTGTETGNGIISAMLYNPGGSPAVNAKVCFYPRDYDPHTDQGSGIADSTITDANGNYSITLDTGITYNLLASGDSGLAFHDSITTSGGTSHSPACTLKTPGTIGGVVELEPGDDPRTVFILFMGTHTFTAPNNYGYFISDPMAGGKYKVRILTILPDYEVMDTTFEIKSGRDSIIPQPIKLKYNGIPTPKNLVVSYDTLNETVMLSWDMPDTSLISGYNVYRSIKGQNFSLITQTPLPGTQTVYYDTNGLIVGNVYEYRVVSRTQAGGESKMIDYDTDTALVISRSMVTTTFLWNARDTASIYDTVPVTVSFSNPTRRIIQLEWYLDTAQTPARTTGYSSLSGNDTVVYYCHAQTGLSRVIVEAVDEAGTIWKDTFVLRVIQDAPLPNAGQDTTVSITDTVRLHGSASDGFGSITFWAWDIGNTGTFITTSGSDTAIITPSAEDLNYLCVLRVTDDDGNIAKDTVTVVTVQDAPVANAGIDTIAGVHDTVLLQGNATQQFGSIVKWEWKIGTGSWIMTGGSDTIAIMPSTEQVFVCSLAVTDDDGNRAFDEMKMMVFIKIKNVTSGKYHTLLITTDSNLLACGYNYFGQLGDGTTSDRWTPVPVMSNVQSTAAGEYHSLILKNDHTLWTCGSNTSGQLGTGDTIERHLPIQVMSDVQCVAAGRSHSLIVKTDNTLWMCGRNHSGQLGDGTDSNRMTPVQVMSDVKDVAAGEYHSLLLKTDKTLWVCGHNTFGQLGAGDTIKRLLPVQVMSDVQSIAAGKGHSLILKSDGTLWTCGDNNYGQLGDGTQDTNRTTPVQVISGVRSMAGGHYHSLIVMTDGILLGCGNHQYMQLGNNPAYYPQLLAPGLITSDVQGVAAGQYHSLILRTNGSLWACGNNYFGQFGNGKSSVGSLMERAIPPQQ